DDLLLVRTPRARAGERVVARRDLRVAPVRERTLRHAREVTRVLPVVAEEAHVVALLLRDVRGRLREAHVDAIDLRLVVAVEAGEVRLAVARADDVAVRTAEAPEHLARARQRLRCVVDRERPVLELLTVVAADDEPLSVGRDARPAGAERVRNAA